MGSPKGLPKRGPTGTLFPWGEEKQTEYSSFGAVRQRETYEVCFDEGRRKKGPDR